MPRRSIIWSIIAATLALVSAAIATAAPPATARIVIQTGHSSPISAAAWTPDGKFLVTGSSDAELLIWNLAGQIIGRAAVGSGDDRTVIDRIAITPDGGGVTIDQLWFKDMIDNGAVASEVRRRIFTYRFGGDVARETSVETIAPPWRDGTPFLAGALAKRQALFARQDWPRSATGWRLVRGAAGLAMQGPGTAPVPLAGALGPSPDDGDHRLEATARVLELRAAAQMSAMATNSAMPVQARGERPEGAPIFSPDGAMIAWRGRDAAVHLLDLRTGKARRTVTLPAGRTLGWSNNTTLVAGGSAIDVETPQPAAVRSPATPVDPTSIPDCPPDNSVLLPLCRNKAGAVVVRDAAGTIRCKLSIDEGDPVPAAFAYTSADHSRVALQSASGYVEIFGIPPAGANIRCPSLTAFPGTPGRLGFHPTKPLFWREVRGQGIAFFTLDALSAEDAAPLFTLYRLPGDRVFVLARDNRYDTDLGPDSQAVRWQVSDAPFQSFPAQTFMRDYFEPRLAQRLIDCSAAGNCATILPPVPPIAALNRVLPQVTITGIKPGATPDWAVVTVHVAEGIDPTAANGKTHSGVFGVRLSRDGKLFRQFPDPFVTGNTRNMSGEMTAGASSTQPKWKPGDDPELVDAQVIETATRDIAGWRTLNRLNEAHDDKTVDLNFEVALPTAAGAELSRFSAYAFNEDRVKGETVSQDYRRPPVSPRPPRAFVVTIGVDDYDEARLKLNFATSDAQLIAERLAQIPGYEVHRITLTSGPGPDGKPRRVIREALDLVFGAMSGADVPVSQAGLSALGFDVPALDLVRSDDIVIVAFSGHGWANASGDFYLLPADARWPATKPLPDLTSLVSAARLSIYLGGLQAREIAVIIDACHSAASVDAAGFKPGPMGDAGLGQLAFDKGIRLLAASQADDVALESVTLKQGLLTYALAGEGLRPDAALADLDHDGRITLDEWLRYGAGRLPTLSADILAGRPIGGIRGVVFVDGPPAPVAVQQPALFDFSGTTSPVVLLQNAIPQRN